MSNVSEKRKVKKADYDRVLITETIPYETPIMFSNDGFYNNVKNSMSAGIFQFIVARLVKGEGRKNKFTVPYTYKIKKNSTEFRALSVIHPYSQWEMREFYRAYEQLICHYTSKSKYSIRAPKSVASSFYYKNSWENVSKYKRGGVSESSRDQYVKHSSSFFAYRGFDRLYKFYNSNQFRRLEKKFAHFWALDVSKCFDSIYTHSIAWATKSKENVKAKVQISSTFGQAFDGLMQRANYNETNGILIGPEISRIFAEIIFQDIDCQVEIQLKEKSKILEVDYSIARYVDDIFIFAQDLNVAKLVAEIYTERLRAYNLHSNSSKSIKYERPFYSSKSRVIRDIDLAVNFFSEKFLVGENGVARLTPKEIYRKSKLSQSFIDSVKAICSENSVGYDSVSSYIISAFFERTKRLINIDDDGFNVAESSLYIDALTVIIDLFYFFYSVAPSVSSSYKLAASVILIARFAETNLAGREHTVKQVLYELTLDLLTGDLAKYETSVDNFVYLEALNIVLAISELGEDYWLPPDVLRKLLRASCSYHDLMSCLFYIKNNSIYDSLRSHICDCIDLRLRDLSSIQVNAEQASLWLDAVACPFISVARRLKWVRRLYVSFNVTSPPRPVICNFLVSNENCYWFTNWHEVDLLNALERKELKQVY
ncbi:antiviral reverse transcriptase Drt3b [Pseudomonas kilonensis]|uniref:antiviral reverse transcriptase Drt3b n=1 Tax=Pseudomonas kilonensis TaxID=132476 RepID=UPI0004132BA1|nr:antiviral reverse transcriptase Drt3b [Pseudomonas kilonensis]